MLADIRAQSGTCLPLPQDGFSKAFPLLSPLKHKDTCAYGPERFELRTSGLGCQVSTITFLTSLVTIFATIAGLIVLYGLIKLIQGIVFSVRAQKGGWYVEVIEDVGGVGDSFRRAGVWTRSGPSWGTWWRRLRGTEKEDEVIEVDQGTGLMMVRGGRCCIS